MKHFALALMVASALGTAALHADATSASMSVSVTVIRSCAVNASGDAVAMTCSKGVNRVSLGAGSDVRALASGSNTLPVSQTDARTGVVTINF